MTTEIEINIGREVLPLVEQAKSFQIITPEDRDVAYEMIKGLRKKWKELDLRFGLTKNKQSAHEAKVSALATYNAFKTPLEEAEEIFTDHIKKFELEEIRRRNAEGKILQAKSEEEIRKAKETLTDLASSEEKAGNIEIAGAYKEQAEALNPGIVFQEPEAPRPEGVGAKIVWKATVTNIQAVCKAIGEGKLPTALVEFKQSELNKLATQWHHLKIEGVTFSEDVSLRIKA